MIMATIIAISRLKNDGPAISPKMIHGAKAKRSLIMFIEHLRLIAIN
jgi:hypothetical protein